MQNPYDEVPYPDLSYSQSHPDRMATLATLMGLEPAPLERCRVLELGCASGGNILPAAYALPESSWVGIDYSPRQIEAGRAAVAYLGLENVTLECMNILDVTPEFGEFDYIIAHGVYAWVPADVRDNLLSLCKKNLAPNGVAYVSYNTYPGWYTLRILRDAMIYHTQDCPDVQERAKRARSLLGFLTDAVDSSTPYGQFLKGYASFLEGEMRQSMGRGESVLLHDTLEEVNDPIYFHQFVEHANEHGLQYLVEAELNKVFPHEFPPDVQKMLGQLAHDIVEMEQYMDFLRNRLFRQTLLVHEELEPSRRFTPDLLRAYSVASRARPVSEEPDLTSVAVEQFRIPDGSALTTDHPVSKMAMTILWDVFPRALPFDEVLTRAREQLGLPTNPEEDPEGWARDAGMLGANFLKAYGYRNQLVELHRYHPPLVTEISERPVASPVARYQAEAQSEERPSVTNLWHERVSLTPVLGQLLKLLDGTRDRAALTGELIRQAEAGTLPLERDGEALSASDTRESIERNMPGYLWGLAKAALLVG